MSDELFLPKDAADTLSKTELERIRVWFKRQENRQRRSHLGAPEEVLCSVCERGPSQRVSLKKVGDGYRCDAHAT